MVEAVAGEKATKSKTEVTMVQMTDGRQVGFAGKRRLNKDILIDSSKITVDNGSAVFEAGAVAVRLDFRSGETRTFAIPMSLLAQFAGHGGAQKYGDELATPSDKPLSDEDMVMAVDALDERIQKGEWGVARESGGFAGASIVVRAIMEASGKSQEEVKAFLQKKLDGAEARGEKLSRKELYDSFRNPNSKTGQIIKRLEEEKLAKSAKVDADEALAELG